MARKITNVTIEADGRDQGKRFIISEMPASRAEKWAMRLAFAVMGAGVDVPDGFGKNGMADIASFGMKALGKIPFDVAEPLLDELMACVQIAPNPQDPTVSRPLIESDVEEIPTRLKLRMETLKLHIDFFTSVAAQTSL